MKKVSIENNITSFFEKFMNTDKMIFAQLKDTINNEQVNLMSSLDDLKNKVKLYFGEETILRNHEISPTVPQSDVNFRKKAVVNPVQESSYLINKALQPLQHSVSASNNYTTNKNQQGYENM